MVSTRQSLALVLAMLVVGACGEDDPVTPSPAINVNPNSVTFQATAAAAAPQPQTVAVTNTGGGSLSGLSTTTSYTSGQPEGWLTATLSQTSAPTNVTLTPTLTPAGGALGEGTYTATVSVAASGARNTPQNIAVTLQVAAAAGHTFSYTPPAGAPAITSVHVPGEFNEWNENGSPMTLQGGTWSVTVPLDPGRYEYKYRINGEWINHMCNDETFGHPDQNFFVDVNATGCEDDPFGGANAFIIID